MMVKGISRQVIVVHSPDPKLFEQAIFILKDGVVSQEGITDDVLLREAKQILGNSRRQKKRRFYLYGPAWACVGAMLTGLAWLLTALF